MCPGKLRAIPPVAGLNVEGSTLTAWEGSAEGIIVPSRDEGPNGRGEGPRRCQIRYCIRQSRTLLPERARDETGIDTPEKDFRSTIVFLTYSAEPPYT